MPGLNPAAVISALSQVWWQIRQDNGPGTEPKITTRLAYNGHCAVTLRALPRPGTELVVARWGKDWIVPSLARTYASSASTMLREDRLREESGVDEVRPEGGG